MKPLDKSAAAEAKVDNRISESDIFYCEQHQAAYETAIGNFKELASFWANAEAVQKEFLGEWSDPFFHNYLASRDGPSISNMSIERHIASLHIDFIMTLTSYFNSSYHVTVDSVKISSALLPEKPKRCGVGSEAVKEKKYLEQMQDMTVCYQDVVDQIILQLDGLSFSERAFRELRTKCHNAAWERNRQSARYIQKKDTICFCYCLSFCTYDSLFGGYWKLVDGMKDILRGAAHFETGSYNVYPLGFSDLLDRWNLDIDLVNFPTCEKLRQLKMFKNGRVDLKFASAELAGEFINKYLDKKTTREKNAGH